MLSKERMIEIAESCGLGPNIAVEYGTSLMEALRAQADAQPMYGSDMKAIAQRNLVSFLTKASFASNVDREAAMNCVEVLASHPAPEAAKPVAWVRFTSDGGYEGPIMDCDRRIDDVRRKSGAWTPLFTRAPEAAQAGLTLDAGEIAFLAARLRRLFEREQYTLPEFARENDSALIGIAGSVIGAILTRASAAIADECPHGVDDGACKACYHAATVAEPSEEPGWKNERCQYEVCDEEDEHDPRCTAWRDTESQEDSVAAFLSDVASQTPEKPDHWSSCAQCQHNAERAADLLSVQKNTPCGGKP